MTRGIAPYGDWPIWSLTSREQKERQAELDGPRTDPGDNWTQEESDRHADMRESADAERMYGDGW